MRAACPNAGIRTSRSVEASRRLEPDSEPGAPTYPRPKRASGVLLHRDAQAGTPLQEATVRIRADWRVKRGCGSAQAGGHGR